jgi:hypothetical protein
MDAAPPFYGALPSLFCVDLQMTAFAPSGQSSSYPLIFIYILARKKANVFPVISRGKSGQF